MCGGHCKGPLYKGAIVRGHYNGLLLDVAVSVIDILLLLKNIQHVGSYQPTVVDPIGPVVKVISILTRQSHISQVFNWYPHSPGSHQKSLYL